MSLAGHTFHINQSLKVCIHNYSFRLAPDIFFCWPIKQTYYSEEADLEIQQHLRCCTYQNCELLKTINYIAKCSVLAMAGVMDLFLTINNHDFRNFTRPRTFLISWTWILLLKSSVECVCSILTLHNHNESLYGYIF